MVKRVTSSWPRLDERCTLSLTLHGRTAARPHGRTGNMSAMGPEPQQAAAGRDRPDENGRDPRPIWLQAELTRRTNEEERALGESAARVLEETRRAQAELARQLLDGSGGVGSRLTTTPSPRATSRQTMQSMDFIRRHTVGGRASVRSGARSTLGSAAAGVVSPVSFLDESVAQQEALAAMVQQSLEQSLPLIDAAERMAEETRLAQEELRRQLSDSAAPAFTAKERRQRAALEAEARAISDAAQQEAALRASEAMVSPRSDGIASPKARPAGSSSPVRLKAAAIPEPEPEPEQEPEPASQRGWGAIRATHQPRQRRRERQPAIRRQYTPMMSKAALKIQAVFRGFKARRQIDSWWDEQIEEDAATRLQGKCAFGTIVFGSFWVTLVSFRHLVDHIDLFWVIAVADLRRTSHCCVPAAWRGRKHRAAGQAMAGVIVAAYGESKSTSNPRSFVVSGSFLTDCL